MATKNSKITIFLEPFEMALLTDLAKRGNASASCLAKELIHEALEAREDMKLSALAVERDIEDIETVSHEEAWK